MSEINAPIVSEKVVTEEIGLRIPLIFLRIREAHGGRAVVASYARIYRSARQFAGQSPAEARRNATYDCAELSADINP
ncbi:unnamed protein product, partial [Iphiclides podalirius]